MFYIYQVLAGLRMEVVNMSFCLIHQSQMLQISISVLCVHFEKMLPCKSMYYTDKHAVYILYWNYTNNIRHSDESLFVHHVSNKCRKANIEEK